MEIYRFQPGSTRLLVSIPHAGTFVPAAIADGMTEIGAGLPDTDWHVDRLYDFVGEMGASVLVATHSRYVVDLNRPPDGHALYPGQTETGVCPTTTFDGQPIFLPQRMPDRTEVARRITEYWRPYHERLRRELDALRAKHGVAVLWDAHSICSRVPRLFEGELPVLNLGTWNGRSCKDTMAERLLRYARDKSGYSAVLDGRFTGGHITRSYGDPTHGIHAVQLELAQRSYMSENSRIYLPDMAAKIRPVLRALLEIAAA